MIRCPEITNYVRERTQKRCAFLSCERLRKSNPHGIDEADQGMWVQYKINESVSN
jgi:hypothetical protein